MCERYRFRIGLVLVAFAALLCLLQFLTAEQVPTDQYSSGQNKNSNNNLHKEMISAHSEEAEGMTAAGGTISVNFADAEELTAIRGIGPVLAERIISERSENGLFCYPEDLLAVQGIGERKLKDMLNQICIR